MRILVLSDTHGDFNSMLRAVDAQKNAEVIIHCGDGSDQYQYIKDVYLQKQVIGVRGNCDWSSTLPATEVAEVGGKRIFITHGHMYQAKFTTMKSYLSSLIASTSLSLTSKALISGFRS